LEAGRYVVPLIMLWVLPRISSPERLNHTLHTPHTQPLLGSGLSLKRSPAFTAYLAYSAFGT